MQLLQMLKASLTSRRSVLATVVMIGVVASVMGLTPTHGASNTLAETCANPPTTPTFNYWPLTYDDVNTPFCHDFPAIDAALDGANPQWSQSQSDWDNGLTLNAGDTGVAGMYIHNGAANNLDRAQTTAKNVHIITHTDTSTGADHLITVTFKADNAASYTKSYTVHTPADAHLEVVPNSGFMYDWQGRRVLDSQNLNLGNSDYALGDLDACFEYSLFLTFKFKVVRNVTPITPTITLQKGVMNVAKDGGHTSTVNAVKGDKVQYRVAVTNNSTVVAKNVTMTDNGVSGISIDSGSLKVMSVDNPNSTAPTPAFSGTIPGTLNLGDLNPGESRYIFYTGTVTSSDCPTLVNTAKAMATGAADVSATARVVVVNNCNTVTPHISIKKYVKNNSTGTSYNDDSVNAHTGDKVNFKITVTNTGNTTLNNVVMTDAIPSGLRFADSVSGDGTPSFNSNNTFSVNFGSISAGNSKTVEFSADVTGSYNVCNVAKATADSVNQVQDNACVNIYTNNGTPNISLSKRAWNDTKNIDATTKDAARGDYITYSLVTTNTGSADQTNYVIRDDLSDVLPLADIVSTNGGTVSGNTITYPAQTIRAGETVVKTFRVRIKTSLNTSSAYQLRNTYGNTIVINVPGNIVYKAPKTGAAGTSAGIFAGLVTAGFAIMRKRDAILKFIFA